MAKNIISLFLVSFLAGSCVVMHDITQADRGAIAAIADQFTDSLQFDDTYEKKAVRDAFGSILAYMAEVKSPEIIAGLKLISGMEQLQDFIDRKFGCTPFELGLDAMRHWESRAAFSYPSDKNSYQTRQTEHFMLCYFPGTKAEIDIEMIAHLAEKQLAMLLRYCDTGGGLSKKFYVNLEHLAGKKIKIILPPNSGYWNRFNATAQMNLGVGQGPSGAVEAAIDIGIPYYNAANTAVMVHEITHMVDLMMKADFSEIGGLTTQQQLQMWFEKMMHSIFPHDTPLGEGFAEFTSLKFSSIHKLLYVTPEKMLKQAISRRPLRTGILLQSPVSWDRKTRLFQYAELHSLVRYLVQKYGERQFMEFYFSPPLNEDTFRTHFGLSYREAEAAWKEWFALQSAE